MTYNALNQLTSVSDALGLTATLVHASTAPSEQVDREAQVTRTAFTQLAEPATQTAPNGVGWRASSTPISRWTLSATPPVTPGRASTMRRDG
jgi:YD repeat-containing protein